MNRKILFLFFIKEKVVNLKGKEKILLDIFLSHLIAALFLGNRETQTVGII